MRFLRQEYWSGLPFPFPGDLPDPGIELSSLVSSALADGFFTSETARKSKKVFTTVFYQHEFLFFVRYFSKQNGDEQWILVSTHFATWRLRQLCQQDGWKMIVQVGFIQAANEYFIFFSNNISSQFTVQKPLLLIFPKPFFFFIIHFYENVSRYLHLGGSLQKLCN